MSSSCLAVSCLQFKHTEHTLKQEQLCWLASRQPGGLHCRPRICNFRLTAAASCRTASVCGWGCPYCHYIIALSISLIRMMTRSCFLRHHPDPPPPSSLNGGVGSHPHTHTPQTLFLPKIPIAKYKTMWSHLEQLKQRGQTVPLMRAVSLLTQCTLIKHCWCVSDWRCQLSPSLFTLTTNQGVMLPDERKQKSLANSFSISSMSIYYMSRELSPFISSLENPWTFGQK